MFISASCVCKSLPCLISALTQGSEGGHLFRLTCSIVLWRWRNTTNKYCWHIWGVLTAYEPHWVCHSPRWRVLSGPTLLRPRVVCRAQTRLGVSFVPFPGPSSSSDQVLGECTVLGGPCVLISSQSRQLSVLGALQKYLLRCAVCLLWGADLRLQPSWQMSTIQDPRWLATGTCSQFGGRCHLWGRDCGSPLPSGSG